MGSSNVDDDTGDYREVIGDELPPDLSTLRVVAFGEGVIATAPLPRSGELVIGRGSCDLNVDHDSVSRRHAVLKVGRTLRIADAGSRNGTRVRGQRLVPDEAVTIVPGEVVELGTILLVVKRGAASERPRRVWTHGYFEGRLEEEVGRARRSGGTFAVVRIGIGNGSDGDSALTESLRAQEMLALYSPGEYELLLVDTAPEAALVVATRLRTALQARGVEPHIGIACYPRDAATAEELLARANAAASGRTVAHAHVDETSEAMRRLYATVDKIATSRISVLILGETGVGKEVMAERVHRLSPRAQKTFLRLNCGALPETLLESELFGRERGAYTGADRVKQGLLEVADGGTVFLDEVGELSLATQVKLLRVLEDKQLMRVGGLTPRKVDVRVVAATNRDIEAEVAAGRFRQDLFFRLNGITIQIPPLRERVGEIDGLVRTFAADTARALGRTTPPVLTPAARERLLAYPWPGNIRELRNVVERAVVLSAGEAIDLDHLPLEKMHATSLTRPRAPAPPATNEFDSAEPTHVSERELGAPAAERLRDDIDALERKRIIEALEQCGGNQTRAARLLGIARNTLSARIDAFGLRRPRKDGD